MKSPYLTKSPSFWLGMLATVIIVVGVRELALVVCTALGMPTATNIVGLVSLFVVLMGVRLARGGLPNWLSSSASVLLVDSGFAFLPVSAGAGILMFGLGGDLMAVSAVIIISTVIPLWAFAKLAEKWLKDDHKDDRKENAHANA
ncbi:CidA/LrgA family protein [Moraxella nasibovis]|uniref:CidA/LrgA family protein n=1 Tax=Moraxella nasibovis TaxID=2904120 RepID=UPI00240F329B|nr:CidA/LrgA family protein [Moraxella nasibovis]WFF39313.1 CidA/LrgA family protein [Moraxella nasibovis]